MSDLKTRGGAILLMTVAAIATGACTRTRDHRGYVVDSALINSVAPGVDNRDSVQKTLGRPSFASEFDQGATWYYVSRDTTQLAFANPKPVNQTMLEVRFAASGDVASVQKTGPEMVHRVSPYGKKTPTRGKNRGFFEDLFGNVSAGGNNTPGRTADNPTG